MTAPQQPAQPVTARTQLIAPPTRGQVVHILKIIGGMFPAVISAIAELPGNTSLWGYIVSGVIVAAELLAHGNSKP